MKNFKFALVAVALIALCSAFATKKSSVISGKFGVEQVDTDRYIVDPTDLSSPSVEYTCDLTESVVCTVQTDNLRHDNVTGKDYILFTEVTDLDEEDEGNFSLND